MTNTTATRKSPTTATDPDTGPWHVLAQEIVRHVTDDRLDDEQRDGALREFAAFVEQAPGLLPHMRMLLLDPNTDIRYDAAAYLFGLGDYGNALRELIVQVEPRRSSTRPRDVEVQHLIEKIDRSMESRCDEVLRLRFGVDGAIGGVTEVAAKYGVSADRVRGLADRGSQLPRPAIRARKLSHQQRVHNL